MLGSFWYSTNGCVSLTKGCCGNLFIMELKGQFSWITCQRIGVVCIMAITKKRFFISYIVGFILIYIAKSGLQYFRGQTINWLENLAYAFCFVVFHSLFSWLWGDFDKKKADH